jgi:hypothetical protein
MQRSLPGMGMNRLTAYRRRAIDRIRGRASAEDRGDCIGRRLLDRKAGGADRRAEVRRE